MMLRRDVVESKSIRVPACARRQSRDARDYARMLGRLGAKCFELKLVCGHTTVRKDRTGTPPRYVVCTDCEKLLERCQEQEGWFMPRAVRGSLSALRELERDGHLESRCDGWHSTTYWKAVF